MCVVVPARLLATQKISKHKEICIKKNICIYRNILYGRQGVFIQLNYLVLFVIDKIKE